jgi:hypothetical protein
VDPAALTALARHGQAVATARAFARKSGAARVVLLIDRGEDVPALMVDLDDETGETEVTDAETVATIPGGMLVPAEPLELPEVRAIPPTAITIDMETGELSAPIGAIEQLAGAVKGLAAALGGRSVATAEFATREPGTPITIAARPGEPPLLLAGDDQFELPDS